ncbi:substrate-binding domain-containing protein [Oceanomicrobium pacificus]|uniref:Substrate-binding domain-containing protein n=1 Tax=Oceanomicrobium pacificus TaxID=2692916 RepID=A0A6B0TMA5_9RHOB|nr:substrate-binding domain-containing protein [Oceanomicrobium pacificus]MXU65026.1 substrate-binding domain-containing protein [Oceanomicrobium pacificus]
MNISLKAAACAAVIGGAVLGAISPAIADDHSDQRYVMVVPIAGHPFWVPIRQGAQDAADQLGVEFEFTGPVEFDAIAQQNQMEQIALTQPTAFLTGAFDPSMSDVIDRVTDMGVPVATFDSDAPESKRITFVGPDHYNVGYQYGKKIVELISAEGKDEGQIGLLTAINQTNLQVRIQGLKDYLAANAPSFEVVAVEDNQGDDQVTAERTKTMLLGNPDIDGIVVINATGTGVATALTELDMKGKVQVVTSDVFDPILCGIMDGAIQTTSAVNTYLEGYMSLLLAYQYVNGNVDKVPGADVGVSKLPPVIDPGLFFITEENAEVFLTGSCS